jgi:antitoxin component YwqK of YwqJK toxin-antitoxin module
MNLVWGVLLILLAYFIRIITVKNISKNIFERKDFFVKDHNIFFILILIFSMSLLGLYFLWVYDFRIGIISTVFFIVFMVIQRRKSENQYFDVYKNSFGNNYDNFSNIAGSIDLLEHEQKFAEQNNRNFITEILEGEPSNIHYHKNGNIAMTCELDNLGNRNGRFTFYNTEGVIVSDGNYKNNLLEGELINFFDNGNKSMIANFSNGVQHGISKFFYETGELESIHVYENGIRISIKNYYRK